MQMISQDAMGNNLGDMDDEEDDYRGVGFLNDMDILRWDLIIKNTPKLP